MAVRISAGILALLGIGAGTATLQHVATGVGWWFSFYFDLVALVAMLTIFGLSIKAVSNKWPWEA